MARGANLILTGASVSPEREHEFFGSIRLGNGVNKTTCAHRLDDVNAFVAAAWKELGVAPREILDAGASSGISSREWADTLAAGGFEARIVASDIALNGRLVSLLPGLDVLVDRDGHILLRIVFGKILPLRRPWIDWVTGVASLRRLIDLIAGLRQGDLERGGRPLMLVSASALGHPAIDFVEDDVLAPAPDSLRNRFDAIRAANILNHAYFGIDDLKSAVINLRQRLAGAGSFLIVVRTWLEGSNHGTLFRLNDGGRFDVVARLGQGSEIENIVLETAG
jgi:hypothetical protein